ncbi:MAG: AAA family ATPase [Parabacteroides sp.]|nr:AAA family ATPase [Parabacteroides sp.]
MASNKLRLQSFRMNDLVNDGGKQFELGKSWCDDFFEFDKTRPEVVVNLKFKAIQMSHVSLNDKIIELKLADVSIRGDRKAYVNGNNGMSQIKDFFINNLHLTPENNLTDYFAIYKVSEFDYYLYFVPSLLYKNFLQFFKSVLPTVSINHNNEDLRTAEKASLQQIFYGAPGTGKSHNIKDNVDVKAADEKNLVFRTTFHPDSDYSTFVGAYKPTTTKRAVRNVAGDIVRDTNKEEVYEDCITYSFIPQAFLQAYVAAWNNLDDKVFLVIEEINRGNCVQIFGDLFQLLDRDDEGASEYPIMADKDIAKYLNGNDDEGRFVLTNKDGIKDDKLRLPKNLYIWATMNTSDQSLFPIDSAFKRRWDWVYMPIADAKKNYVIEIDNDQYDWWSFLEAINDIIESTTHSEDKKLGYFFAKAKDGRITVETFVSKVIFYLWNDVFKDNETNHKAFKDNDGELLPFRKFFHHDGTVDTNMVIKFLQDLEVYPFETSDDGTAIVSNTTPNTKRQRDKSRYRVNGTDNLNKAQMTREAFKLYIEAHPDADAQAIEQAWNGLGLKDYVRHLVETEDEYNARTKDSTDSNKRATEFELSNGEKIYLSTQFGIGNIGKFMDAVNNAGWNIRIENQA